MIRHLYSILLTLVLALALPLRAQEVSKHMNDAADSEPIEILNSGSTNHNGYKIRVSRQGAVQYTPWKRGKAAGQTSANLSISRDLSGKLFVDIAAAGPLDAFAATHCAKSASFGYTLFVKFKGATSPDLSCGNLDPKLKAVLDDINKIVAELPVASGQSRFHPISDQ